MHTNTHTREWYVREHRNPLAGGILRHSIFEKRKKKQQICAERKGEKKSPSELLVQLCVCVCWCVSCGRVYHISWFTFLLNLRECECALCMSPSTTKTTSIPLLLAKTSNVCVCLSNRNLPYARYYLIISI